MLLPVRFFSIYKAADLGCKHPKLAVYKKSKADFQ